MDQFITIESHREPWNKGKLVGQKAPFKLKEIWAIRVRPQLSSFSKNRHGRFRESGVFRHVFENVLRRCMSEGLVGGEGFAVDASVVKADASRARRIPGGEMIDWLEADGSTRAVKEYLDALEENGAPETTPKLLSLTDPAARWTAAPGGPAFFGYSINYLIDLDAAVIVDVEATPALRTEEVNATRTRGGRSQAPDPPQQLARSWRCDLPYANRIITAACRAGRGTAASGVRCCCSRCGNAQGFSAFPEMPTRNSGLPFARCRF
jgi:hypothetical protein